MKYLLALSLLLIATFSVNVPNCATTSTLLTFSYLNGTRDNTTIAALCHDNTRLTIKWLCTDKEIISTYQNCNDPLFKEDVVEIFISTLDSYPHKYFEFEVSSSSRLFFGDITNPNGNCTSNTIQYFNCDLATYQAQRIQKGWAAELNIDLLTIGRGKAERQFKVNLFRVDYSSKDPTRYLAWQPTYTNPACFHKPSVFQQINLI